MTITRTDGTLTIGDIDELATGSSQSLQSALTAALPAAAGDLQRIDVDLSHTRFVDCGGLGALLAMRKCARSRNRNLTMRLLHPPRPVKRMVSLMRMGEAFGIE